MGVLPLCFEGGQGADELGLDGSESFTLHGLDNNVKPLQSLSVTATHPNGKTTDFDVQVRLDTPVEVEYYRNGGILQTVVRNMARA